MRRKQRAVPHSHHDWQISNLADALLRDHGEASASKIYVLSGIQKRAGTSTIARLAARELARHNEMRVLLTRTSDLARVTPKHLSSLEQFMRVSDAGTVLELEAQQDGVVLERSWEFDLTFARTLMQSLRDRFDVVLLDAGDLLSTNDVSKLASLADGVVLIVEAGHNTRAQIEYALQILSHVGGHLKGFVLNRRQYPIPDRIYRWLRS